MEAAFFKNKFERIIEMNYKKLKPQKLYEQIAEIIEQKICSQHLSPGEKLDSVEQLAKTFEVGRSAIREALTSLQAKGLIEIRQGEGTYVKKITAEDITLHIPQHAAFSTQDLQQIFEVRKILELGVIEKAALRRTKEQLELLKQALQQMSTSLTDAKASSTADIAFHSTIAAAANNPLLVSMLANVSKPISTQIQHTRDMLIKSNPAALIQLHEEHIAIYEALVVGNQSNAKTAMERHLSTVEKLLFIN